MRTVAGVLLTLVLLAGLPTAAFAESRIPAGGAFMNSYTTDPYFDPKSLWSQQHSRGDIGGQVMLAEPPGSPRPCALFDSACAARFERNRRHAYEGRRR